MNKQSFGEMISSLRKDRGMTQLDLAKKMGVTDKAVSKWERDLSFPDINSIPKLAEIFDVSVDELMQYISLIGSFINKKIKSNIKLPNKSPIRNNIKYIKIFASVFNFESLYSFVPKVHHHP